jgi:hypothetical protein
LEENIGQEYWTKISDNLREDPRTFYFSRRHQVALKALPWCEIVAGFWDSRGRVNVVRTRHDFALFVITLLPFRIHGM